LKYWLRTARSYFRSIPTCVKNIDVNVTHRQTDGKMGRRTDGQTDGLRYCGITALCMASRGKNYSDSCEGS